MSAITKTHLSFTGFIDLLKSAGQGWVENKSARLGAALAFYSVLSLAPLLLLILSAAAAFWSREAAQGQLLDQMRTVIGEQGAEAVQTILSASAENKTSGFIATLIGLGTLLFSASGVFCELQDAMNSIWHAKPRQGQAVWVMLRERFLSFTMVMGSGFLMLISFLVSAGLSAMSHFINDLLPQFVILMQLVNFLISFGVISLLFAMTFKVVPDVLVSWGDVCPGGALTAALFVVGKMLIGFYLGHAGINSTYGAAGSFVALLVWVYYSAQILFFGAEFTYAYHCRRHPETGKHEINP